MRSWQRADGSFQPSGEVKDGTWVTALAVTLASVRGIDDASVRASVDWLLSVVGAEHNIYTRVGSFLHLIKARLDVSHEGWPWREGNATWIEPTAHTLVALKKIASRYRTSEVEHRVRDGEELIVSRRCTDGGWNYGTPNMLYVDLPSYPETTALALLGLVGRSEQEYAGALEVARAIPRPDPILARESLAADRAALSWQGRRGAGGKRVRIARRDAGIARSVGTSGRELQIVPGRGDKDEPA